MPGIGNRNGTGNNDEDLRNRKEGRVGPAPTEQKKKDTNSSLSQRFNASHEKERVTLDR